MEMDFLQNIDWRRYKPNKGQIVGLIVAITTIVLSIIFLKETDIFYFVLGLAIVIAMFPFFVSIILTTSAEREREEMFLEFARNLVENVKAGTPISKSILNVRKKDYGKLNPHINKLANQIALGIPVKSALETFSRDVNSLTVTRAVTIISEAEKAGGKIDDILEAVAKSVSQVEKLKKERRAAMYTLMVQGYIIFFIFIIIMLVMQFKILPIASGLGSGMGSGAEGIPGFNLGTRGDIATAQQLAQPFLWLLIAQGFFAGLVIGKLAEGKMMAGLKHSFILVALAVLISTGAKVLIG
ncbi:MAG: type II secretion system F family protein [Candidatus Nanoarchaeia archaeon]|nr:type II secretion system F family protein [Candidatus Nanoarchaeia archaeon]MDD5741299.1 type II secretion system F family protein [Candidatus Nanoarchaeia archaeon]